jgi:hypothetical protein
LSRPIFLANCTLPVAPFLAELGLFMPRIGEKLESMKARAVKVCAKGGIGKKAGLKKNMFLCKFSEKCLEKVLTIQGD